MAKFLQTLGFSLDEIALSLGQIDAGMMSKRHGQAKLTAVLDRVEGRIDDLKRIRNSIRKVIADCQVGKCQWDPACDDARGTPSMSEDGALAASKRSAITFPSNGFTPRS